MYHINFPYFVICVLTLYMNVLFQYFHVVTFGSHVASFFFLLTFWTFVLTLKSLSKTNKQTKSLLIYNEFNTVFIHIKS